VAEKGTATQKKERRHPPGGLTGVRIPGRKDLKTNKSLRVKKLQEETRVEGRGREG